MPIPTIATYPTPFSHRMKRLPTIATDRHHQEGGVQHYLQGGQLEIINTMHWKQTQHSVSKAPMQHPARHNTGVIIHT